MISIDSGYISSEQILTISYNLPTSLHYFASCAIAGNGVGEVFDELNLALCMGGKYPAS